MQYAPHTNTTASLISERVHSLTTTSRAKKQRRMAIIIWLCSSTHLLNYLCDWAARNKQYNESTLFDMVLHTRNFIFIGKIRRRALIVKPITKASHCTFHAHFLSLSTIEGRESNSYGFLLATHLLHLILTLLRVAGKILRHSVIWHIQWKWCPWWNGVAKNCSRQSIHLNKTLC